jgi:hypothetical protein
MTDFSTMWADRGVLMSERFELYPRASGKAKPPTASLYLVGQIVGRPFHEFAITPGSLVKPGPA